MLGRGQAQLSWGLSHLLGVVLDAAAAVPDMHPEPSMKSQAVVVHRQSQDLWAALACTAPVQGYGSDAGQNVAHLGLDAGAQAGPTSPGR